MSVLMVQHILEDRLNELVDRNDDADRDDRVVLSMTLDYLQGRSDECPELPEHLKLDLS